MAHQGGLPMQRLARGMVAAVVLAVLVVTALLAYADVDRVVAQIARIGPLILAPVILMTLVNYALRWVKWHYLIGQVGVRRLGYRDSVLLFCAGMSMVLSPGKVGELLKSYYLRRLVGTPMLRSAPVIFVERLSDGFALLILAAGGVVSHTSAGMGLVPVTALLLTVLLFVSWERPVRAVLHRCQRWPALSAPGARALTLYVSAKSLVRPRVLLPCVFLGIVSWGCQAVGLVLILMQLGLPSSPELLLDASFILASAILVGSASLLPGGLGASEASLTGLLQVILSLPADQAVATTLLIRLGTLWLGVLIGLFTLPLLVAVSQRTSGSRL